MKIAEKRNRGVMDGYEIPAELPERVWLEAMEVFLSSPHWPDDTPKAMTDAAAAAYRAGQQQAAREIAEQIETTEWLNCAAFARKARDYGAMVTS